MRRHPNCGAPRIPNGQGETNTSGQRNHYQVVAFGRSLQGYRVVSLRGAAVRTKGDKQMTGEMSKDEVTRDAYPLYFASVDALGRDAAGHHHEW